MDDAPDQAVEVGVLSDRGQVGPDLGRRIAQPHRVDVAGADERLGSLIGARGGDRRVERVRQRVGEQAPQTAICDPGSRPLDPPLDRCAAGGAVVWRRSLPWTLIRDAWRASRRHQAGHGRSAARSGGPGRRIVWRRSMSMAAYGPFASSWAWTWLATSSSDDFASAPPVV